MFVKNISKSVLLIISSACVANAYIVPGAPGQLPGYQQPCPPDQYGCPQDGGGNSGPVDNPYQPPTQPSYGNQVKSIYIGRSVQNESLPLRQLAGLDSSYNGFQIVSIRGNTQPNSPGRTLVQLVADGRIIASQINPGYQINLFPNSRLVLGQTVRSLQLVVSGSTVIQDLQIEITSGSSYPTPPTPPNYPPSYPPNYPPQYPPQQPYPPTYPPSYGQQQVDLNVYRSVVGNDRIDLTQYVNLSAYRGYAVQQVIVTGSAQFNVSFVSLMVNGLSMGQIQFDGSYAQTRSINLVQRPIIGQGADSLVLYTQGNMTVQRVTLILSRGR